MRHHIFLVFSFVLSISTSNYGQVPVIEKGLSSITSDGLKAQLGFLSSDWMEGREAGEKGAYLAADYIASMLKLYGIAPMGDLAYNKAASGNTEQSERSYFQNFILLKSAPGDAPVLKIRDSNEKTSRTVILTYNVDFALPMADQSAEIDAPVVFAGYGYIDDAKNFNDFSKLDVRGKYILKLAGFPGFLRKTLNEEKAASLSMEMEIRYKAMGIAGILEYDPEEPVVGRPEEKDFMNLSPSETFNLIGRPHARYSIPGKKYADNLIKIEVSVRAANEILRGSSINADEYKNKADKNETAAIPGLKGKSIYLKTDRKTSQVAVRNVIGLIEGKNPDKFIVLGAHYDHIGSSNGFIWNGADDNGSGTVGVMAIARAIAATGQKPETSIIFAFWTAEEEGLLGSRHFVRNLKFPTGNLKLNMNFDMISRYISDAEPNNVTMTYNDSFPWFRDITAANLKRYGIDLNVDYQPSSNPPGGSDHRSFVEAGIPVIRFKPGHREEYHTPMDETGTVDWDIMEKIVRICFADTWDLANSKW